VGMAVGSFRRQAIKYTDGRVRMMSEVLTCIKLIKMYAWENAFARVIGDLRNKERAVLRASAILNVCANGWMDACMSVCFCGCINTWGNVFTRVTSDMCNNKWAVLRASAILNVLDLNGWMYDKVCMRTCMCVCHEYHAPHIGDAIAPSCSLVLHQWRASWDGWMDGCLD
jgi:hypothetical protein